MHQPYIHRTPAPAPAAVLLLIFLLYSLGSSTLLDPHIPLLCSLAALSSASHCCIPPSYCAPPIHSIYSTYSIYKYILILIPYIRVHNKYMTNTHT